MAWHNTMAGNRRRNRKPKNLGADDRSPWGSLFRKKNRKEEVSADSTFFTPGGEEDEEEAGRFSLLRELWQRFNFWGIIATLLFLTFTGALALLVLYLWTPQSMDDITGYADKGRARDLTVALAKANGEERVFTEGEINRYLRDTCRMRQTGLFSIIAHAQGVAVRLHDGYAELIIDRLLGANIHQTTSVHLSFSQKLEHGHPVLRVDFRGGEPILGNMPRGGRIGLVAVPERHILMLEPALATLTTCYPDFIRTVEEYGYLPIFSAGSQGEEGTVRFVPHSHKE